MKKIILMMLLMVITINFVSADVPLIKATIAKTDPIIPTTGDYFDLWIKMENSGNGETEDLTVEFVNNYPFSVENERIVDVGVLGSQKDYHVKYTVRVDKNAIEGDNTIIISYSDNQNRVFEKKFLLEVKDDSAELVVGNIRSSPLDLTADTKDAQITINIQNIGEGQAKLVNTKLVMPQGIEASNSFSDTYSISSINSDESEDAIFHIDIDENIKEGTLPGMLVLNYKDGDAGEYKTERINIEFPIKSTPKFNIVEVRTVPETFGPGDTVELFLEIKNDGGKDGESVSIRGYRSVSLPIEFDEKSNLVGTIKSDSTGVATLKFTVDKDATPKEYLMDIEIRTVYGERVFVYDETINFEIGQKQGSNFLIYGIVVIVLIIGFFIYKRKK